MPRARCWGEAAICRGGDGKVVPGGDFMRCTSATTGKTRESSILTRSEGVPECDRRPRCIYPKFRIRRVTLY